MGEGKFNTFRWSGVDNDQGGTYASSMEVQFTPDIEAKLDQLANETGRAQSEFVQDAVEGFFAELVPVRELLDRRYDELLSGTVKPIPAEDVFRRLLEKSDARRSQRNA